MFNYFLFGLNLSSELEFPELISKSFSDYDIIVKYDEFDSFKNKNCKEIIFGKLTKIQIFNDNIYFFWNDIEIFLIKNSKEVLINPINNMDENFLRLLFLGYVMAILLYLRGILVLHANAINIKDNVILLLGERGKGKSTTSFALYKKGHNLISDDMVCIKMDDEMDNIVLPGFPRIKLWPEIIKNFNENPDKIPKIHENSNKRSYLTFENFSLENKSLNAIYIIEEGLETTIQELNYSKAAMELVKNSYCFRLFNKYDLSENLMQCSKIANQIPIKLLKINRSLTKLNKVVETIESDIN